MPTDDIDLLAIDRGLVAAPAGCGKTSLIAETLSRYTGAKPILVLTHTNAGVAALRVRLDGAGVPSKAYRLSTIDGWAIRLISTFPRRSAHDPAILQLGTPESDYQNIRAAAAGLLRSGHVNDILAASYSRLIVDEYQDCSIYQHEMVVSASQILPTCVLGDRMQAIFSFGSDNLVRWEEVCSCFPLIGELTTPRRWINAGAEPLGRWLREVREKLSNGEPIDLRSAPTAVKWVELDGAEDHRRRLAAARERPTGGSGRVLIIGDSASPDSRHLIARQTPGAVTVEAVELKDLLLFARNFNPAMPDALRQLIRFAQKVMTNVDAANLIRRVETLIRGRARTPPTEVEQAALAFLREPSHRAAAHLLMEIEKQDGVRTYRPVILQACIKALRLCDGPSGMRFYDAAIRVREENRMLGRSLPRRAVGSTLLLKGLEAEVAVILDADALDTRNLYVALTRGSKALTICSSSPVLNPH